MFHSGATEGINTAVLGLWLAEAHRQRAILFVYSPLDHACVRAQGARLKALGHKTVLLAVDQQGNLLLDESIDRIRTAQREVTGATLINFTWVHNETGVVWPLTLARRLKESTGAWIHVDAAQAIGKVADCWQLTPELDIYSFSSHKCGGLKGHGWTFYRQTWPGEALILGGSQQKGWRAGTENALGAYGLRLALEELQQVWRPEQQAILIEGVRSFFDQGLKEKGFRVANQANALNLNTVLFVSHLPSDMALPLFDLAGLELSAGAACSSGAAQPSPVLEALGYGAWAKNGLRLSTSWGFAAQDWEILRPRLAQVFKKLPLA